MDTRKFALVIGNSEYEDPTLARLKTPDADVRTLAAALREPSIGRFNEVTELVNQPESVVSRAISAFFAQKKPDDMLLLYFSGHGVLDPQGRLFLAVKDTQRDFLKATALSASFITDEMDTCRSKRQLLILDCCHSGAFARGTKGEAKAVTQATFEGNGYGRVVLTASDSTQYALEGDQVIETAALSLFTHYLLEGLTTGEADTEEDGVITLDEWYDYAYDKVVNQTPQQTPRKWVYNQQGDLVIAKNPRPKAPKPAELPVELKQALESPFASVRVGALEELGRLLGSSNSALALAARSSLERLAKEDDSRRVANTAAAILAAHPLTEEGGFPVIGDSLMEGQTAQLERERLETERLAEQQAEQERQAQEKARQDRILANREEQELRAREAFEQAGAGYEEIQTTQAGTPIPPGQVAPSKEPGKRLPDEEERASVQPRFKLSHLFWLFGGVGILGIGGLVAILILIRVLFQGSGTIPTPETPLPSPSTQPFPSATQPIVAPILPTVTEALALATGTAPLPPAVYLGGGGGKLAFVSSRDGNWDIYVMNLDGSGLTRLTDHPSEDTFPVWSPNGQKILFHSNEWGNFDLYVMDPDGSDRTRLTTNPTADTFPDWSPDGRKIVFQSRIGGTKEIFVMNTDGSNRVQLTHDSVDDSYPAWSSDGSRIAFTSERDGNPEIYVMNADGSHQTRLTYFPGEDSFPDWSPDGERIVFASAQDGNNEIYLMNADGSGSTNLTDNPAADDHPRWSPDGAYIAFDSDREGSSDIYIMKADGSGIIRLTNDPADDPEPSWQP